MSVTMAIRCVKTLGLRNNLTSVMFCSVVAGNKTWRFFYRQKSRRCALGHGAWRSAEKWNFLRSGFDAEYRISRIRLVNTVVFTISPHIVAPVHKNQSYVECAIYSHDISLIYVKVQYVCWGPAKTQLNHGFRCFTRHRQPQDERIICSYSADVFRPCMHTGWLLRTSPSDQYWWW